MHIPVVVAGAGDAVAAAVAVAAGAVMTISENKLTQVYSRIVLSVIIICSLLRNQESALDREKEREKKEKRKRRIMIGGHSYYGPSVCHLCFLFFLCFKISRTQKTGKLKRSTTSGECEATVSRPPPSKPSSPPPPNLRRGTT